MNEHQETLTLMLFLSLVLFSLITGVAAFIWGCYIPIESVYQYSDGVVSCYFPFFPAGTWQANLYGVLGITSGLGAIFSLVYLSGAME